MSVLISAGAFVAGFIAGGAVFAAVRIVALRRAAGAPDPVGDFAVAVYFLLLGAAASALAFTLVTVSSSRWRSLRTSRAAGLSATAGFTAFLLQLLGVTVPLAFLVTPRLLGPYAPLAVGLLLPGLLTGALLVLFLVSSEGLAKRRS